MPDVLTTELPLRRPNPSIDFLDGNAAARLNPAGFVEPIIWGWKRDAPGQGFSRLVYFSARHVLRPDGTVIESPFLFYAHQGPEAAMEPVVSQIEPGSANSPLARTTDFEIIRPARETVVVRIVSGQPSPTDLERLRRLASRQPEGQAATPPPKSSSEIFDLRAHGVRGCDLLAGSGLSYESGLPMLKQIHDLFWVDDGHSGFCLGARDRLPALLQRDLVGMFQRFTEWHVKAAAAKPSKAHLCLVSLRRAGFLHNVFTDNIDRLFALAGIEDYVQVRGSGVINEVYPVKFHRDSNALLVIGVSADRRGIIAQARERGLKIIVVNPYSPVSPGARNLDYLIVGDVYFRLTAGDALPRILASTSIDGDRAD